jgi:hypothetical protein
MAARVVVVVELRRIAVSDPLAQPTAVPFGAAPPLTLVTLDRTPYNIITKSVGEAVRRVYPPAVLRLREQSLRRRERASQRGPA